jgi:hypothetical protein
LAICQKHIAERDHDHGGDDHAKEANILRYHYRPPKTISKVACKANTVGGSGFRRLEAGPSPIET